MFKYIIILIKTIYLNFRIFPFSQAITFPVIVGPNVSLTGLYKGCVKCPSKFALVRLGVDNGAFELNKGVRSRLSFEGNGGGSSLQEKLIYHPLFI